MLNVQTAGALAGIKVVDLSRVLAGPFASQILGDHGADVIKVEPPGGDETREWGPPFRDDDGKRGPSAYYLNVNRNKRGVALDLRQAEGREALLRLLADADVVMENFKSGTMEKWDLGYDAVLAPMFPKLIYACITGFGTTGPFGGFPGYDAVVQTMTGMSSVTGSAASGPVKMGTPVVDLATGLNSVIGILMALRERDRTGKGQRVEVALYDVGLTLTHPHSANWMMGGKLPSLTGNAHPNVAPYDLFETATRPIFLGCGNDGQFRKAMAVLGRPDLTTDERFRSMAGRNSNRAALTQILAPIFAQEDGVALSQRLLEAGVPAGPLNNVAEALQDPQTEARGMRVQCDGYQGLGSPIKLSATPPSLRRLPPDFGADSEAVLREAGFSDDDILGFRRKGVIPER